MATNKMIRPRNTPTSSVGTSVRNPISKAPPFRIPNKNAAGNTPSGLLPARIETVIPSNPSAGTDAIHRP